jgi:lipopolysaccharide export system protein LptC
MKRLPVIVIVVVVLLLGQLVFHNATPKEPSYQGRTLTQWVREYLSQSALDSETGMEYNQAMAIEVNCHPGTDTFHVARYRL